MHIRFRDPILNAHTFIQNCGATLLSNSAALIRIIVNLKPCRIRAQKHQTAW